MRTNFQIIALKGLWVLLLAALFIFQIILIFQPGARSEKSVYQPGQKVNDFTLQAIDGKSYQLDELVKSEETLLVFISANSGLCRIQAGEIDDYLKRQSKADFQAVLISDDSRSDLASMQKDLKLALPILADPEGKIMDGFGISNVPASFLIDKDRKLINDWVGSEGFSVYKIQALLTTRGATFELQERPKNPEGNKQGNK